MFVVTVSCNASLIDLHWDMIRWFVRLGRKPRWLCVGQGRGSAQGILKRVGRSRVSLWTVPSGSRGRKRTRTGPLGYACLIEGTSQHGGVSLFLGFSSPGLNPLSGCAATSPQGPRYESSRTCLQPHKGEDDSCTWMSGLGYKPLGCSPLRGYQPFTPNSAQQHLPQPQPGRLSNDL